MPRYTGRCPCGARLEVAVHPDFGRVMNCPSCFPAFPKETCEHCGGQIELAGQTKEGNRVFRCTCCGICSV